MSIGVSAAPVARLSVPTFVIGPEHQGRGYKLLADSGVPRSDNWIVDLPMVLLEWAKLERKESVAACLPVASGASVVFRARYVDRAALGPEAYIHGAYCGREVLKHVHGRTEWILSAIPNTVSYQHFALQPLAVARTPQVQVEPWQGLGLAYADRFVIVDHPIELSAVLGAALASIDPPEHRIRIAGWTTSPELPARGSVNPLRQCQLILSRSPPPPDLEGHFLVRHVGKGKDEGPDVLAPPSRMLWERLRTILSQSQFSAPSVVAATDWRMDYLYLDPSAVAEEVARAATRAAPPNVVWSLLLAMSAHRDSVIAAAGLRVAEPYMDALATAGYLSSHIGQFVAAGPDSMLTPKLFERLDSSLLSQASDTQLAEILQVSEALIRNQSQNENKKFKFGIVNLLGSALHRAGSRDLPIDLVLDVLQTWHDDSLDLGSLIDGEALVRLIAVSNASQLPRLTKRFLDPGFLKRPADEGQHAKVLRQRAWALTLAVRRLAIAHG